MRYLTSIKINMLAVIGILGLLTGAYFIEYFLHEPPCPLCLLQRWGFLATLFGFLLNLKFGNRMQHYGIALFGILFTAAVAMRQILLHIFVSSAGYGASLFGFHLYTWSFVTTILLLIFIAFALTLEPPQLGTGERPRWVKILIGILFTVSILYTLANATTTFLICGLGECPESPVKYLFSKHVIEGLTPHFCS